VFQLNLGHLGVSYFLQLKGALSGNHPEGFQVKRLETQSLLLGEQFQLVGVRLGQRAVCRFVFVFEVSFEGVGHLDGVRYELVFVEVDHSQVVSKAVEHEVRLTNVMDQFPLDSALPLLLLQGLGFELLYFRLLVSQVHSPFALEVALSTLLQQLQVLPKPKMQL
jgi:hypothetical protein